MPRKQSRPELPPPPPRRGPQLPQQAERTERRASLDEAQREVDEVSGDSASAIAGVTPRRRKHTITSSCRSAIRYLLAENLSRRGLGNISIRSTRRRKKSWRRSRKRTRAMSISR